MKRLTDNGGLSDDIWAAIEANQELNSELGMHGHGHYVLRGPGNEVKQFGVFQNIITQIGDQYYGERASGIATPPAQVTGMKLGTGTTAVAKTGAGAALVTYTTNSHQAIDGSFPTSSIPGTVRRIQWKTTWAAGKATATGLAEVVIVIDALADATSTAANTVSRALLSPTVNKGASDSLAVTWSHDLGT